MSLQGVSRPPLAPRTSNPSADAALGPDHDAIDLNEKAREAKGALTRDEASDGVYFTKNPSQIRRQINNLINNGGMKVREFCDAICVSSTSYYRFMRQNGNKGECTETYVNALKFFQKREAKGIKMPRKQTAKQRVSTGSGKTQVTVDTDVSSIHLDGEEDETVPLFDTCDELRKKLAAHLRSEGATQAALARGIAAQFPGDVKISVGQLQTFQNKKGPRTGGDSRVFYGGYVFMEKLRIKNKKPKTKFRQEMEQTWPDGFPRQGDRSYFTCANERPYSDKYGVISFG